MAAPWLFPRRALLAVAAVALTAACFLVQRVGIEETVFHPADSAQAGTPPPDSVTIRSAVRAHLLSGHTVVYRDGVTLARDSLRGPGLRYDLSLHQVAAVSLLPLDSVLGMEDYHTTIDGGATVGYSLLATVGVIGATVAIACAADPKCFGSCPTFYSDSGDAQVLEAEGFSYSIAPLFEGRDVDRLRAQPGPDGVLRLEVRNEAYETHYLNQLELLEARHAPGETVLPDAAGRLLAVAARQPPLFARDAAGRDLRPLLRDADGVVFATDPSILAQTGLPGSRVEDTVELALPVAGHADSVALILRFRNSLLNTVLLYDLMLGDPGARSLDWTAGDLSRAGPAFELAQWYMSHLGMRVEVQDSGVWRERGRIRDTGPVAWKDLALLLPAPPGDTLRVRLSFVADNWRIDRVGVAIGWRRPAAIRHELARVVGAAGAPDTTALAGLRAADARYLVTTAGQRFTAVWDVGVAADPQRTFLLASQGYYIEWIRRGWLAAPRRRTVFAPGDDALPRTLARYREVKDDLERRFAATRVPVR